MSTPRACRNDPDDQRYFSSAQNVTHLRVTNDLAERGVALMKQFNLKLTQDEQQRLLQMVKKHRHRYPDATKPVMTG